eukprot:4510130-Amphidinium_carterae.1
MARRQIALQLPQICKWGREGATKTMMRLQYFKPNVSRGSVTLLEYRPLLSLHIHRAPTSMENVSNT